MINIISGRASAPCFIFVPKWKFIAFPIIILFFLYVNSAQADEFDNAYKLMSQNNFNGAIAQLEPLAKNGNVKAQITLAIFYMKPRIKNIDMAKYWLSSAANKNSAEAQEMLGNLIMCGETAGIQKECYGDFSSGRRWLELAFSQYQQRAKNGDCSGYERMANFYLDGKIVPKDVMKGIVMLKTAS